MSVDPNAVPRPIADDSKVSGRDVGAQRPRASHGLTQHRDLGIVVAHDCRGYEVNRHHVGVIAWVLAEWGRAGGGNGSLAATAATPPGTLVVRMGLGSDPSGSLAAVLAEHLAGWRLVSVGTARQGAAVEVTYEVRLKGTANPVGLIAAVNRVEGVQNVEWTETTDDD